ncbi:MAG: SDR family oxidoreductase [Spirochaetes bacterium]|nr:SDR family oxidoreductase [Spirochaetota bacterium]
MADNNRKKLPGAAGRYGESAMAVPCDITKPKEVKSLMKKAAARFGGIDILVNNAGVITPNLFEDCTEAEITRQINVNLMGSLYCAREAIPHLKSRGGGYIVTIASLAGIVPETYSSIYTATKFAMRGLFLALHLELKRHRIHAGAIFPDSVHTPMLKYEAEHGGSPLTFLRDPRCPEDVARAVLQAVLKKKVEVVVPSSQGFITRFIMVFPKLFAMLCPKLEKQGEKRIAKLGIRPGPR